MKGCKYYLPKPSDAFLKAYCEQGGIDEGMVEYKFDYYNKSNYKLKVAPDNTITIKPVKESWNREEVIKLVKKSLYDLSFSVKHCNGEVDKWIEENL